MTLARLDLNLVHVSHELLVTCATRITPYTPEISKNHNLNHMSDVGVMFNSKRHHAPIQEGSRSMQQSDDAHPYMHVATHRVRPPRPSNGPHKHAC